MKFTLDENLGAGIARVLREAGHDVSTVYDQKLHGATDDTIYDVCRRERRCLVTLDLDFADGTEARAAGQEGLLAVLAMSCVSRQNQPPGLRC